VLALFVPVVNPIKFELSIIFTGIALLTIGGIKGLLVEKSIPRAALETFLIGSIAAILAFIVGYTLRGLAR
jgi:VIT1/CCC1 family predicted Fe2+/Mn2+ transporter